MYHTSRAKNGQLEFVKANVLTPIQGSSSVVMIYVQGKHFYTCHNVEMAEVGEWIKAGAETKDGGGGEGGRVGSDEAVCNYVMF